MAERLYDKEIADRLAVADSTVKTHVKPIYGELTVSNRREAVGKAEELGVLQGK
jgi:LuxR family maltose regulon positive regulatory protein